LRDLTDPDVPVFRPWFFYGFSHARPQLVKTLTCDFSAFLFRAAAMSNPGDRCFAREKSLPARVFCQHSASARNPVFRSINSSRSDSNNRS
ncbi:hypothetical protein, partial [Caballeronia cordobensis]|uniref:hypothetical protein n=1 Tax=Caballeronia cordobensis TaxID=1353886 RepID=UPI001F1FA598